MTIRHLKSFLILILVINYCFAFSQAPAEKEEPPKQKSKKEKDDKRFFIRAGIGAQGIVSFIFPTDLNNYTQDFYDHLLDEFYEFGYMPDYSQIPPIFAGYGYALKGDLRLFNVFQIEPWWERFWSFPLQIKMDYYYDDYYNNYHKEINATYQFIPEYDAQGISLYFVPGSARRHAFITVGGGFGKYSGRVRIEADGTETINGDVDVIYERDLYEGQAWGYNGSIGLTYVPWKYFEIETLLSGKYVNIPELKNQYGEVFRNIYDDNQPVALQLSGIEFRLGMKFIFP
jgi:hypothetical protein